MPFTHYAFTCDNCGNKKKEGKYPAKIILKTKAKFENDNDCSIGEETEFTVCAECRYETIHINKHLEITTLLKTPCILKTTVSELEID
jgi:hypothetical protein